MERDVESLLSRASIDLLTDGTYFGEIEGLAGVWGSGRSADECRGDLRSALEEWLAVSASHGELLVMPAADDRTMSGPLMERVLRNAGFSRED
jgi:predicted RNase H-like HicB family nuclease